jgi:hypothetical protein
LALVFSKSPIGLDQISFSLKPEKLEVKVIASNNMLLSPDSPREIFEHCNRLANLFLTTPKNVDK